MNDLTRTGSAPALGETAVSQRTVADGPALTSPDPLGYALLSEIGRGGMGVVFRARDLELDREVAVKLLLGQYAATSAVAVRFLEEARITGRLQHPGIPAVYRVGALPDGRPFLAMKLIKGRTLDELLRAEGAHPSRWLSAFESVCHAVGYAHARGVIHRDLKPSNVMVGAFGEVQVMDWGLAKLLGANPTGAPVPTESLQVSAIAPPRDSDGSLTQAGSVLGTLAYMPPEQAAGEVAKIDRRADVFALGAILCALLTGQAPYLGETLEALRAAAIRGNTSDAFARLDACGADAALVALCKRCMAFEPSDRPENADAVATAIADLRRATDERLRQAERDRHAAEVRGAEQAKRQRALLWSALAVVAVLVIGVAASLLQAKRARDAEAATATQLGKTQEAEAAVRARADELNAIFKMVNVVTVKKGQEEQAVLFHQRLVAFRERDVNDDPTSVPKRLELRDALGWLANAHNEIEQRDQAVAVRERQLAISQYLVAHEPNNLDFQSQLAYDFCVFGNTHRDNNAARVWYERAVDVCARLVAAHPTNDRYALQHLECVETVGFNLRDGGELLRAKAQFEAALSLAQKLNQLNAAAYPEYVPRLFILLGAVTRDLGELPESREWFRKAIADYIRIAKEQNRSLDEGSIDRCHMDIGKVSELMGDFAGAASSYHESLVLRRKFMRGFPHPNNQHALCRTLMALGSLAEKTDDDKAALAWLGEALPVAEKIEHPEHYQLDVESLRQRIADCRARLANAKPREVAPPPRLKPEN
jgi:serine/threonine protein kinase